MRGLFRFFERLGTDQQGDLSASGMALSVGFFVFLAAWAAAALLSVLDGLMVSIGPPEGEIIRQLDVTFEFKDVSGVLQAFTGDVGMMTFLAGLGVAKIIQAGVQKGKEIDASRGPELPKGPEKVTTIEHAKDVNT